uniref:Uncharacterized protein n=1 Tax=Solanum tuberosum TaxID=4113 RepID=M1C1Z0_SOLTU
MLFYAHETRPSEPECCGVPVLVGLFAFDSQQECHDWFPDLSQDMTHMDCGQDPHSDPTEGVPCVRS